MGHTYDSKFGLFNENNHIVKFWPILISHFDFIRYAQLKTIEDERRAYEAKMKPIWDAEKAVKKEAANRESMLSLAAAAGVKVQIIFKDTPRS